MSDAQATLAEMREKIKNPFFWALFTRGVRVVEERMGPLLDDSSKVTAALAWVDGYTTAAAEPLDGPGAT